VFLADDWGSGCVEVAVSEFLSSKIINFRDLRYFSSDLAKCRRVVLVLRHILVPYCVDQKGTGIGFRNNFFSKLVIWVRVAIYWTDPDLTSLFLSQLKRFVTNYTISEILPLFDKN